MTSPTPCHTLGQAPSRRGAPWALHTPVSPWKESSAPDLAAQRAARCCRPELCHGSAGGRRRQPLPRSAGGLHQGRLGHGVLGVARRGRRGGAVSPDGVDRRADGAGLRPQVLCVGPVSHSWGRRARLPGRAALRWQRGAVGGLQEQGGVEEQVRPHHRRGPAVLRLARRCGAQAGRVRGGWAAAYEPRPGAAAQRLTR